MPGILLRIKRRYFWILLSLIMDQNRLKIRNLFYEEKNKPVLKDFNLLLEQGEVIGVFDPAGLACLPLLQICATLVTPLRGKVYLDGIPVPYGKELSLFGLRRKIAYITQESALISSFTLVQNVYLGWAYHENNKFEKTWETGEKLLDIFQIRPYRDSLPTDVNSEILKRAICAREMAKEPRLILLDSVIESLSNDGQFLFLSHLDNYRKSMDCSILMASSGTSFLSFFAKFMDKSHIIVDGSIENQA